MKFVIVLSVLLALAAMASARPDLSVGRFLHPEYPNKCVMDEMILDAGTVAKHPSKCAKVSCHNGSNASIVTCPAMVPPAGCEVKEPMNPEANYPQCCRRKIVCKDGKVFSS